VTDARRRRARRVAAATAAVVVALAIAESAFRAVMGERFEAAPAAQRPQDVLGRHDADVGWTLVPGKRMRVFGQGVEYDVALNARGFRGPAHDEPPAPGRRRIALLGDSTGFGWGVDDGATFGELLERDPRLSADVANLCVPGYSTDQELWTLEREGPRLAPDLVLVQFSPNDLEGCETTFAHKMLKPRFVRGVDGAWRVGNRPVEAFVPVGVEPPSAAARVLSNSALWQVLSGRTPLVAPKTPSRHDAVDAASRVAGLDLWRADGPSRHAFELLVEQCRALGARLVSFAVPPFCEPDEPAVPGEDGTILYATTRRLARLGRDVGFETVSLDRAFHDAWAAGADVTVPDGHWNARGHRIAAETLAPTLAAFLTSPK